MSTIKVKPWGENQGDFVLIDEKNFKEGFHEKYEQQQSTKKVTVDDLKSMLTDIGVEFDASAKKAELQALYDQATSEQ